MKIEREEGAGVSRPYCYAERQYREVCRRAQGELHQHLPVAVGVPIIPATGIRLSFE